MQNDTLSKYKNILLFSVIMGFSSFISSIDYIFALETNNSDSNMLINANMTNKNSMNISETNEMVGSKGYVGNERFHQDPNGESSIQMITPERWFDRNAIQ